MALTKDSFVNEGWTADRASDPRHLVRWHEWESDGRWDGFKVEVIHAVSNGVDEYWTWRAFSTFAKPIRAEKDANSSSDAIEDAYDSLLKAGWIR